MGIEHRGRDIHGPRGRSFRSGEIVPLVPEKTPHGKVHQELEIVNPNKAILKRYRKTGFLGRKEPVAEDEVIKADQINELGLKMTRGFGRKPDTIQWVKRTPVEEPEPHKDPRMFKKNP